MPKLPGVNHLDAVRALQKVGFWVSRQGKHIVMTDGTRILTIPDITPSTPLLWAISPETQG
jgi:predicted RNA binding protein YcfA (HicA-like mRNA interferase family)